MDLFETMATISKAHGYDILSDHVEELKAVIKDLIETGELDDLEFTEQWETERFKAVLNKAKILSL